jgi:hypothetical protein
MLLDALEKLASARAERLTTDASDTAREFFRAAVICRIATPLRGANS